MKQTQIKIQIHPTIYLIPKKAIQYKQFNEVKQILLQWLMITIEMRLVKSSRKPWKTNTKNS
jgi:hypothetical protein